MISGAGLCWQHVGGVGSTTTTTTTIPRKKLLERIIDQFVVIKTDIWDRKNDKTKKEAAGENNRSISCH